MVGGVRAESTWELCEVANRSVNIKGRQEDILVLGQICRYKIERYVSRGRGEGGREERKRGSEEGSERARGGGREERGRERGRRRRPSEGCWSSHHWGAMT